MRYLKIIGNYLASLVMIMAFFFVVAFCWNLIKGIFIATRHLFDWLFSFIL